MVEEFLNPDHEAWAEEGERWIVETAYSTSKRLFSEHYLARVLRI